MIAVLSAEGLTRRFGGLVAVGDVSLALPVGQLHALIGPNGAGKSTLCNLLSGELAPSAGRLRLDGADVTGWPPWRLSLAGVARTFQRTDVLRGCTVAENARLAAQSRAMRWQDWLRPAAGVGEQAGTAALARVGLADRAAALAGALSHGELRLLEIALALATAPRALLLDEPLAGLGPEESERMAALLRTLAADHAVLLVEHDMEVVFAVADTVTVMVDGRVLAQGAPEAVRADPAVRDAYLGHAV